MQVFSSSKSVLLLCSKSINSSVRKNVAIMVIIINVSNNTNTVHYKYYIYFKSTVKAA